MNISCYFLCALIVLAVARRFKPYESFENDRYLRRNESSVCSTKACVEVSEKILTDMDPFIDPCEDFYKFACGNFLKNNTIPKEQSVISTFMQADFVLSEKLQEIIKNPPKDNELRSFKMVKHFFNVCMDEHAIEARGVGMLLNVLNNAGRWPVLEGDQWDASSFDWMQAHYNFSKYSLTVELFKLYMAVDFIDPYKYIITIDEAKLDLSREVLIRGKESHIVTNFTNYMIDIFVLLGANRTTAERDCADIADFVINMANIAARREDRRDRLKAYNPMTVTEIQQKYPYVKWELYINNALKNFTKLKPNETIVVKEPDYFQRLGTLLNETEKRTIANYMLWSAVSRTVPLLPNAYRKRNFEYMQTVTGVQQVLPRWDDCFINTLNRFSLAISSMYIRNFFKNSSKEIVTDMVHRLRKEMLNILEKISWMDIETRAKAIEKNRALKAHVAYPDELLVDSKVERFYEKLDIFGDPYFEAALKYLKFNEEAGLKKFRERINKTDWRTHSFIAQINAFYSGSQNAINIPAGILQESIFSSEGPQYLNYATIGFAIGHEITHGYDDQGRYYDKRGSMVEWWKNETSEAFKERSKCVIDQANMYTVEDVNLTVNGINTQGENMADVGGAMLAMKAYKSWVKAHGEEPRLTGLEEFTPMQTFWIKSANLWCTKNRKQSLWHSVMTGVHPPEEYRVYNFVRNQKQFAIDFRCPVGSKMNPADKCNVWKVD